MTSGGVVVEAAIIHPNVNFYRQHLVNNTDKTYSFTIAGGKDAARVNLPPQRRLRQRIALPHVNFNCLITPHYI